MLNQLERGCHKPIQRDPSLRETAKCVEILDPFGSLRYKVVLTSVDVADELQLGMVTKRWCVQVLNCFSAAGELIVVERPDPTAGEAPIRDGYVAEKLFRSYVDAYRSLVKAETRDFQDIEVCREQTGYMNVQPECCATCKWCKRSAPDRDFFCGATGRLECWHPLNSKACMSPVVNSQLIDRVAFAEKHGCWNSLPCDGAHEQLHPFVQPFGLCEKYIRAEKHCRPAPGTSINDYIDMRFSKHISGMVSAIVSAEVSSQISSVEMSSVCSVDISSIGDALSSGTLSSQLAPAVAAAVRTSEVSTAVASVVRDAAQSGSVTLIGNNGMEFRDENKNNVPDEYEDRAEKLLLLAGGGA